MGGMTNDRPGTDHVTSEPMKGLKICTQWRTHTEPKTDGHGDSLTESAQWGRFSENITLLVSLSKYCPFDSKFRLYALYKGCPKRRGR